MSRLALLLAASLVAPALAQKAGSGMAAKKTSRPVARKALEAGMRPAGAKPGTPKAVEGLRFRLPEAWQDEAPANRMRKAQVVIPGEAGDAQLTVFHFGPGGGGGIEANLQRWEAQVEADEGAEPERKRMKGVGTRIHLTSLDGTLKPSRMSGRKQSVPGQRLMGAVVEAEGGPWFFKVVGPAATVRRSMPDFVQMLAKATPDA